MQESNFRRRLRKLSPTPTRPSPINLFPSTSLSLSFQPSNVSERRHDSSPQSRSSSSWSNRSQHASNRNHLSSHLTPRTSSVSASQARRLPRDNVLHLLPPLPTRRSRARNVFREGAVGGYRSLRNGLVVLRQGSRARRRRRDWVWRSYA